MQTLVTGKIDYNKGFSLIEILIVMFIMAFVLSNINFKFVTETTLKNTIDQLEHQVNYALDYATFKQKVLGLTFHQNGYYFSNYHPPVGTATFLKPSSSTWRPLSSVDVLKEQKWDLDEINLIDLNVEGDTIALDDIEIEDFIFPQIVIFPNYEVTDFSIDIYDEQQQSQSLVIQ